MVLHLSFLKYEWGCGQIDPAPSKKYSQKVKKFIIIRVKVVYSQYLHPADRHPAKIRKIDEISAGELDFKDIQTQVKIKGIRKIEKNNSIGISVFGYENKKTSNLCIKKML